MAVAPIIYPEQGAQPSGMTMSSCEVLCWIAYRRAIPKRTYFAPLCNARANGEPIDLEALLHTAIPDPKPIENPMSDAEKALMAALRSGEVQAISQKNQMPAELLPINAYRLEVVISARGYLEPDNASSPDDYRLAAAEPTWSELRFYTAEVIRVWPATLGANGAAQLETPTPRDQTSAVTESTSRKGNSLRTKDLPLVQEMKRLILSGQATGRQDAARAVSKDAAGKGDPTSKTKRLVVAYSREYPDSQSGQN